jgi:hypothetical protein
LQPLDNLEAGGWPDDVRLSDLEPRFTCQACGLRGADMGLDFDRKKQPAGGMGYR